MSLHWNSKGEKWTHGVSPSAAPRPAVAEGDGLSEKDMEAVSILAGMWVEASRVDVAEASAGVQVTGTALTAAPAPVQVDAEETEDEAVAGVQTAPTQVTQPEVAAPQAAAARPARNAAARSRRRGGVQDPFHNYSQENPPPKVKKAAAERKASEAAAAARKASGSVAAAGAGPSRTSVAPPPVAGPSRKSRSWSVTGPSRETSGALSAATDVTVPDLVEGTRKRSVEEKEEAGKEEGNKKTRYGRAVRKPKRMEE